MVFSGWVSRSSLSLPSTFTILPAPSPGHSRAGTWASWSTAGPPGSGPSNLWGAESRPRSFRRSHQGAIEPKDRAARLQEMFPKVGQTSSLLPFSICVTCKWRRVVSFKISVGQPWGAWMQRGAHSTWSTQSLMKNRLSMPPRPSTMEWVQKANLKYKTLVLMPCIRSGLSGSEKELETGAKGIETVGMHTSVFFTRSFANIGFILWSGMGSRLIGCEHTGGGGDGDGLA